MNNKRDKYCASRSLSVMPSAKASISTPEISVSQHNFTGWGVWHTKNKSLSEIWINQWGQASSFFVVSGTCGSEVTVWVIVGHTRAVNSAWPVMIFELSCGHNLVCNSLLRNQWQMMSLQRPCHLTSPAVLLLLRRRRQVWQRYSHFPCHFMHLLWGKIDTVIIIFHFKVDKTSCFFSIFANLPVIHLTCRNQIKKEKLCKHKQQVQLRPQFLLRRRKQNQKRYAQSFFHWLPYN